MADTIRDDRQRFAVLGAEILATHQDRQLGGVNNDAECRGGSNAVRVRFRAPCVERAAVAPGVAMARLWVCDDEPSARFPVFTRGNIGEVFGDPVSPLTWTALGIWALERGWREGYYEMGLFTPDEFKPLGEAEILACFGGYLYINMSVLRMLAVRIPGLSMEAIDRSAFGDYADVPPYRPDPRDRNPDRAAQMGAWVASLFTTNPLPPTDADRVG